jgi:hypothetical protein
MDVVSMGDVAGVTANALKGAGAFEMAIAASMATAASMMAGSAAAIAASMVAAGSEATPAVSTAVAADSMAVEVPTVAAGTVADAGNSLNSIEIRTAGGIHCQPFSFSRGLESWNSVSYCTGRASS